MNKNVVDIIMKKITKKELITTKIVKKTVSDIYKNPIEYLKFYPIDKEISKKNVSISVIKEKEKKYNFFFICFLSEYNFGGVFYLFLFLLTMLIFLLKNLLLLVLPLNYS